MWSELVVVAPPSGDEHTGMGEAGAAALVQTFVPEASIEALGERSVGTLAGRDPFA